MFKAFNKTNTNNNENIFYCTGYIFAQSISDSKWNIFFASEKILSNNNPKQTIELSEIDDIYTSLKSENIFMSAIEDFEEEINKT